MLARKYRLRTTKDVARVYRRGQAVRGSSMSLKWLANQQGHMRAAVVVSKKVAPRAPLRNRIRRRVYEHLRQISAVQEQPVDLIFNIYSDELATMPSEKLNQQLLSLLQKCR